jgi:hypothetical protein
MPSRRSSECDPGVAKEIVLAVENTIGTPGRIGACRTESASHPLRKLGQGPRIDREARFTLAEVCGERDMCAVCVASLE